MNFDKDNIYALIGTIVIHLLALFLIYQGWIRTPVPVDEIRIPIVFEEALASVNTVQQPAEAPPSSQVKETTREVTKAPTPRQQPIRQATRTPAARSTPSQSTRTNAPRQAPTQTQSTPTTKPITQEREKTVAVADNTNPVDAKAAEERAEKEREAAEQKRAEEAERKRQEELRKQGEAIDRNVDDAFSKSVAQVNTNTQSSNQGATSSSKVSGSGLFGTFVLGGRSLADSMGGRLPTPSYTEREEGKIVINITVDPNGNVISAEIGRGTNIDNITMRNNAKAAANKAKFKKIQGTNNQTGTITYNYRLT